MGFGYCRLLRSVNKAVNCVNLLSFYKVVFFIARQTNCLLNTMSSPQGSVHDWSRNLTLWCFYYYYYECYFFTHKSRLNWSQRAENKFLYSLILAVLNHSLTFCFSVVGKSASTEKKGNVACVDDIFLPKDQGKGGDLGETERLVETFKRFCSESKPEPNRPKVNLNTKHIFSKHNK